MKPDSTQRGSRIFASALAPVALAAVALGIFSSASHAQTHKVATPQTVVRAVGVYEWTGDMAKPAASRLIPVSLFIDGKLQDAAVYLAAPVPMSLLTGNVYQLQKSGIVIGDLDLAFARHLVAPENASTTYDDGWFGYGKFVALAQEKKSTLKASSAIPKINGMDDENSDEPHFSSRSATPGSGEAATPIGGAASASSGAPADDPDRPTLHRSSTASNSTADAGTGTSAGSAPPDDADRPTLRRRTPAESKDAKAESNRDSVTAIANSLNDDPNRPVLHRGKPVSSMNETDIPKLSGLPGDQDLHQRVAVSDAVDHSPHDFARAWDDDAERQAILSKMETAARAQLSTYEAANGFAPAAPTTTPVHKGRTTTHHVAPKPAIAAPPEPLLDETLTGFTLSYGGAATFVYQAHTDGLGSAERFVTLVAQVNMNGQPEIALKNVTDAAHLDRTPRMKLVDVVDAEASNRASLLFELRAQNSRQFALYRVIGARADQTFVTGSTQ
jgi:hypothetical protein